jgi:hypothetical protein
LAPPPKEPNYLLQQGVTPGHLATTLAGLEATDIVSFFIDIQSWWEEDTRVPEYINKLEDVQKKALRASLPITNKWLVATASKSLLIAASFPPNE